MTNCNCKKRLSINPITLCNEPAVGRVNGRVLCSVHLTEERKRANERSKESIARQKQDPVKLQQIKDRQKKYDEAKKNSPDYLQKEKERYAKRKLAGEFEGKGRAEWEAIKSDPVRLAERRAYWINYYHEKRKNDEQFLEMMRINSKKQLRRRMELFYTRSHMIISQLDSTLLKEQVSEPSTREVLLNILDRATFTYRNEASLFGLDNPRKDLKVDLIMRDIDLVIEWKNTAFTVFKDEFKEQISTQRKCLENQNMGHFDHIVVSVDGSVGTFDLLKFFIFFKDRVNSYYAQSKVKRVNFDLDIFNLVMDKTIQKLEPVKHLFVTAKPDLVFELIHN